MKNCIDFVFAFSYNKIFSTQDVRTTKDEISSECTSRGLGLFYSAKQVINSYKLGFTTNASSLVCWHTGSPKS